MFLLFFSLKGLLFQFKAPDKSKKFQIKILGEETVMAF